MRRFRIQAPRPAPQEPPSRRRIPPIVVRTAVAALIVALFGVALSQAPSVAAPRTAPTPPPTILPANVGIAVAAHASLALDFAQPMDVASVAASLQVAPASRLRLSWSVDARHLQVAPAERWLTDERYVLVVPGTTRLADGSALGVPLTFSFTTQTAPYVDRFEVDRVGADPAAGRRALVDAVLSDASSLPSDTADETSARTQIRIRFSTDMDHADVERAFLISPAVAGSFRWDGPTLIFSPSQRLKPGSRYGISIPGAHDAQGNPLGGDTAFSFTTYAAARVVRVTPADGATGVSAGSVQVSFSAPVDTTTTRTAFHLLDATRKAAVAGSITWNQEGTRLTFKPKAALAAGHRFEVKLQAGAADLDGNPLTATYAFTTKAPPPPPRPVTSYPSASGSSSGGAYALSLINASRKAYGFAPLRLDAALSAVAQAHAVDQVRYNYFSHVGRDGSTYKVRITRAGISFSHAGENQCLDYGSLTHAISWCHSYMMAEPYPGVWNHIWNILDPNFTRVGFGYGRASDGKLIMTWDFAG